LADWTPDPFPQAGQFGRQGGELSAELLVLLLLHLAMLEQFKKSSPNADRCGGPGRF
jgi:hypothetical protein